MAIIEAMQDQKKILASKIQAYEKNKNNDEETSTDLQKQLFDLQQINGNLLEKLTHQSSLDLNLKAHDDEKSLHL